MDYKQAGVDVEAGYKAVELMKKHVDKTMRPEVISGLGGFGGLFSLGKMKLEEPVLVSGTDGVGTKLKLAFEMDKHDTIGIDCVAMCVNDIICSGAQPLFFLDYIACGKNVPIRIEQIVKGVSEGCIMSGCALIGGETAEMPGFYSEDEYDMAGFTVGIVDRKKIIDGSKIKSGDVLIGLPSSGVHSNGFSLVRKLIKINKETLDMFNENLGSTIGEAILAPTKIYVKTILDLCNRFDIKGICNITGGGFIENIPRMLCDHLNVKIDKGSWPILPVFNLLQDTGNLSDEVMYNTFNMGIGMVMAVSKEEANEIGMYLNSINEKAYVIGEITESGERITIC